MYLKNHAFKHLPQKHVGVSVFSLDKRPSYLIREVADSVLVLALTPRRVGPYKGG
jgi:hypothetical protein